MLDAHELRRRLVEAMDTAKPKVTSAHLAEVCKVTPQAVNGWRKNGRLAKRHLARIAAETGKPLEYFLGAEAGTVTVNYGLVLKRDEAEAMKALQNALPEWRKYVLGLALVNRVAQETFLVTMGKTMPDAAVKAAYGDAPHVEGNK